MAYNYNIISGDSHIDMRWLPGDLFVDNAPAKWEDRVPQLIETKEGLKWFAGDQDMSVPTKDLSLPRLGASRAVPPRGSTKRLDRMHDAGFYDGRDHPTTPEIRINDQDMDGVDAEVIYGPLIIDPKQQNAELVQLLHEIYNTWVADFQRTNPDRFVPLALLANHDTAAAADELRRAAKLGLKGAEIDFSSASKPIWHKDWDLVWAAADECQMPISFHARGIPQQAPHDEKMHDEYKTPILGVQYTVFQLAGAEIISSLIFSGALERFPGFHFVLGECGAVWLPYVLARMDFEYDDQFSYLNFPLLPSGYWRRQGHTTFQREPLIADVLHLIGEETVMWGSDYPHGDGVWPDSQMWIQEDMGRLSPEVRRKLTRDNAGTLYRMLN